MIYYTPQPLEWSNGGAIAELIDLPTGVLLQPVVVPALRHVIFITTHVGRADLY